MNEGSAPLPYSDSVRPSPEDFLELIARERRGRLKIYIGHAAGTGKTVQMLHEGNDLARRGKRVIGAYVETHGRPGTDAVINGLEILPRLKVPYKNTVVEEMDLQAVLAIKPDVAIVDELPHTNAPGSGLHTKRWQDIDTLLDAGISVITAMNIQHLESLGPVVQKVTGVLVRETVPDSFVASADEIVSIDVPAAELRDRLRRGEIYAPNKIEAALQHFFTESNLTNLRELALRETVRFLNMRRADQRPDPAAAAIAEVSASAVDAAVLSPLAQVSVDPVVMVATSSRPPDVRSLLRKAAAIAHRLNTHWYLAYVETPNEDTRNIDATTQRILLNNIALAKDLGATVVRLRGKEVAQTLADFAREYGVTHAIFGSSPAPQSWARRVWHSILGKTSVAQRFHQLAPDVDLHICFTHPIA